MGLDPQHWRQSWVWSHTVWNQVVGDDVKTGWIRDLLAIQPSWKPSWSTASVWTPFSISKVKRNRERNLTLTSDLYTHSRGWVHLTHKHTDPSHPSHGWKLKPLILTLHHFYHSHVLYSQEQLTITEKREKIIGFILVSTTPCPCLTPFRSLVLFESMTIFLW